MFLLTFTVLINMSVGMKQQVSNKIHSWSYYKINNILLALKLILNLWFKI